MATSEHRAESSFCNPQLVECRPFLKWAGGKSQLLKEIRANLPLSFDRYFEPFLGGGALFFALQPKAAVLTDINTQLVNAFSVVRDDVDSLVAELAKHKERHSRRYYYKLRAADRQNDFWVWSDVEKAARLIYLNKTCFNGLYRVNTWGQFNVPLGDYKQPTILDEVNLRACSSALKEAKLKSASFEEVVEDACSGDFVYLDPPYFPLSPTASFSAYSKGGFTTDDHRRLKEAMAKLTIKGVRVMLSNSSAPFVLDLFKEFDIRFVESGRAINSKGDRRGKIKEVIVRNY